jgi:predicted transcriptional regulator of viral defense system
MISIADHSIQNAGISVPAQERAIRLFRTHPAGLRTQEALRLGIHPRTLYALRDRGVLEALGRGLYRLATLPPLAEPDLVIVARKVPHGVICLLSALAFHNLTTQVPHAVHLALERGATPPRLAYPPLRVFWFSGAAFHEGIEEHRVDEAIVRVYGPEKTVADCFKFRHKLGLDVALEALRLWRRQSGSRVDTLLHYARIDRVERIIRPYHYFGAFRRLRPDSLAGRAHRAARLRLSGQAGSRRPREITRSSGGATEKTPKQCYLEALS